MQKRFLGHGLAENGRQSLTLIWPVFGQTGPNGQLTFIR